jgi:FMN phosphatase YigB (HAD superfamily)
MLRSRGRPQAHETREGVDVTVGIVDSNVTVPARGASVGGDKATLFKALVITDLDNTLYDYGQYFEGGLRTLVPEIITILGVTKGDAIELIRKAMEQVGNLENPWFIDRLLSTRGTTASERRVIAQAAQRAFWVGASAALEAYPEVEQTLHHLKSVGTKVVAHTDAPIHQAIRRLRYLRLDRFIDGIVANSWFKRERFAGYYTLVTALPGFANPPRRFNVQWRLADSDLKPNSRILDRIVGLLADKKTYVLVVGDSIQRDVEPALKGGYAAAWARYGRRDVSAEPLLQSVVHSRLPDLLTKPAIPQNCTPIDSFGEVLEILPGQMPLPFRM